MNRNWKAFLGVTLVFILGGLAGSLITAVHIGHRTIDFFQRGPVAYIDLLERRMTGNLALDPGQKQQVHEYLMQNLAKRKSLQAQIQPEIQRLNLETFRQIKTILRPDQMAIFQGNLDKFHKRFGQPNMPGSTSATPTAPGN